MLLETFSKIKSIRSKCTVFYYFQELEKGGIGNKWVETVTVKYLSFDLNTYHLRKKKSQEKLVGFDLLLTCFQKKLS